MKMAMKGKAMIYVSALERRWSQVGGLVALGESGPMDCIFWCNDRNLTGKMEYRFQEIVRSVLWDRLVLVIRIEGLVMFILGGEAGDYDAPG